MGVEIERKFLVKSQEWKEQAIGIYYQQGYLSSHPERAVRIRTVQEEAFLTIKGKAKGAIRNEYEYQIPYEEAVEMLMLLCEKPIIEKKRYKISYDGLVWEVDEFEGENKGLIVAEVELSYEGQTFELPPWIGEEVTGDQRFFNSNLIKYPFSKWG